MSIKHFCDACEDPLDESNSAGRQFAVDHKFQATSVEFRLSVSVGSNVDGCMTAQAGDLCTDCRNIILLQYLIDQNVLPDPEEEADETDDIEEALGEEDDEDDPQQD